MFEGKNAAMNRWYFFFQSCKTFNCRERNKRNGPEQMAALENELVLDVLECWNFEKIEKKLSEERD